MHTAQSLAGSEVPGMDHFHPSDAQIFPIPHHQDIQRKLSILVPLPGFLAHSLLLLDEFHLTVLLPPDQV